MGRLLLVGVCVAVVFAGCSGPLGQPADEARTVNPRLKDTPTRSPTPTPTSATPPGVGADRIDSYTLVSAHRRALANTSSTLVTTRTIIAPNGTVLDRQTVQISTRGTEQYVSVSAPSIEIAVTGPRVLGYSYWTNGTVTVVRYPQDNGTVRYERVNGTPPTALSPGRTGAETIARVLGTYRTSLAGTVTRNGTTLYVLTANETRPEATLSVFNNETRPRPSDWDNISVRLLVTQDGIVRAFEVRFDTTLNDRRVTINWQFRVTAVGTATVPRPPWVDSALNNSTSGGT